MTRRRVTLACALVLSAAWFVNAQAPAPADPLTGWAPKAELDILVAKLRSGELKGPQTIFERPNGPYRVYTSFIDGRIGAADIHEADDELYVVLSGAARSTLGGEITDKKLTAPHEYRGTRIKGGISRPVAAGDIISAPRGTPHQMDATGGHILYVVIKIMGSTGSSGAGGFAAAGDGDGSTERIR
jgi:mannose-6-phosphate isomerase-like protein (cupin superfamily)